MSKVFAMSLSQQMVDDANEFFSGKTFVFSDLPFEITASDIKLIFKEDSSRGRGRLLKVNLEFSDGTESGFARRVAIQFLPFGVQEPFNISGVALLRHPESAPVVSIRLHHLPDRSLKGS